MVTVLALVLRARQASVWGTMPVLAYEAAFRSHWPSLPKPDGELHGGHVHDRGPRAEPTRGLQAGGVVGACYNGRQNKEVDRDPRDKARTRAYDQAAINTDDPGSR
jgi:hypothetical protein